MIVCTYFEASCTVSAHYWSLEWVSLWDQKNLKICFTEFRAVSEYVLVGMPWRHTSRDRVHFHAHSHFEECVKIVRTPQGGLPGCWGVLRSVLYPG